VTARTHPPTARRLREARRRGEVPVGRGLVATAATGAGLATAAWGLPSALADVAAQLRGALAAGEGRAAAAASLEALATVLRLGLPSALAAAAGALVAGLLQTRGLVAPDLARPQARRLAPGAGLRRAFSPLSAGRAALSLAAALAALAVTALALRGILPWLASYPRRTPGGAAAGIGAAARAVGLPLLAALATVAGAEAALVRHRHRRALRMTRAEVERDHREEEGDPRLRAERRRRHGALAAGPPSPPVAVVVVNPTHLAVALTHPPGGDLPPRVAWMASGTRAAVLRRRARRSGVPVVEDVPLARSLFRLAEAGEPIPDELHHAVAVVLARVAPLAHAGEWW
jgi:flagellar biosynthesis protein FlhB